MTERDATPPTDPWLDAPLDPELEAALDSGEPIAPALKGSAGESVGAAVGSFMAGIEQQIFQRRPPGVELVQEHAHHRGTSTEGLEITIDVPPVDPER